MRIPCLLSSRSAFSGNRAWPGAFALLHLAALLACKPAAAETARTPSAGMPKISCDEPVFNFGRKENTEAVTHTFTIRNTGTGVLNVLKVRASCGCTVATVSDRALDPGETAKVTATLKLKGRRGPQHKTVNIESNDPKQPRLQLALKGEALIEVGLEPPYLNFGQVSATNELVRSARLVSMRPGTRILDVTPQGDDAFRAEVRKDNKGRATELVVRFQAPQETDDVHKRCVFLVKTDHPHQPIVTMTASAMLTKPVYAVPSTLVLSRKFPAKAKRAFLVRGAPGRAFRILNVSAPKSDIETAISELTDSIYRVTLSGLTPDSALNGKTVEIETDVKGHEKLSIPIKVVD